MAHFAQLDENNVVIQVIVVNNNELLDGGPEFSPFGKVENEQKGIDFCKSLFGVDTRWVQTSYNGNFRKRYAGVGYTYYSNIDAFAPPKPEQNPSWVLNSNTANWEPPSPRPVDTVYIWDEPSISWIAVPQPFPSWVAQGSPLSWTPPTPRPSDGKRYKWDEPTLSWVEVPI